MNLPRSIPILALVMTALVLHAVPVTHEWLEYRRAAILNGEVWRLFSGHLIHISGAHLFWNCAMILISGGLIEQQSRRQLRLTIGLSLLSIGPLLLLCEPGLATYAGLSGIAAAGITSIVTTRLIESRANNRLWLMIALLLLAKLVSETFDPTLLLAAGSDTGYRSVPLAHIFGAAAGIFAALANRCSHPRFDCPPNKRSRDQRGFSSTVQPGVLILP